LSDSFFGLRGGSRFLLSPFLFFDAPDVSPSFPLAMWNISSFTPPFPDDFCDACLAEIFSAEVSLHDFLLFDYKRPHSSPPIRYFRLFFVGFAGRIIPPFLGSLREIFFF